MQKFVHQQNLARYIDLLAAETDPVKRELLHRLLIEEEDRFGGRSERLNEADRLVASCAARLNEQRVRVARLREDGDDAALSEAVLANMSRILDSFVQYRQALLDGLDRSRL